MPTNVFVSFTGGKDSVLVTTLLQLQLQGGELQGAAAATALAQLPAGLRAQLPARGAQVTRLVTFAPFGSGVTSFRAHPFALIQQQAAALNLPHSVVEISGPDFSASYTAALRQLAAEGMEALATGDITDVCSGFMETAAANAQVPLLRPLWGLKPTELLSLVWALKLQPIITCINLKKFRVVEEGNGSGSSNSGSSSSSQGALPPACLAAGVCPAAAGAGAGAAAVGDGVHEYGAGAGGSGHCAPAAAPAHAAEATAASSGLQDPVAALVSQELTAQLHARVLEPAHRAWGVDVCGEWGEFHTAVLDGPTFAARVDVQGHVERDSEFAWLVPTAVSLVAKG